MPRRLFNPQFPALLHRVVLRNATRHPLLAALNIFSVALGVAVFLAIQIANHSASRSFGAGIDLVAGKSHLEIRGPLDETLFPKIASYPGVVAATPLVEDVVTLPDFPGEFLRILGVDLFTNAPFSTFSMRQPDGSAPDIEAWLSTPNGIAVTPEFAERHGLSVGDSVRVVANAHVADLRILLLLAPSETGVETGARIAVMDIGWAQELFDSAGSLASVQVLTDPPEAAEKLALKLAGILPPDVEVAAPSQRSFQVEKMLAGFKLNLTALSMVAMLVGMFLIYNTITASAVRRRREIGILRSLGAGRGVIRALFLGEALAFGIVGIAIGLVGGVLLASTLIGSVAKTITSLYVLTSIDRSYLDPLDFATASVLGMLAVAAAAWFPANRAATTDPVEALALSAPVERESRVAPAWAIAGVVLLLAGLAASIGALNSSFAWLGFGAAFCVLTGFVCFSPGCTVLVSGLVHALARRLLLARMAAANLTRAIHRNSVTIASLAAAVAMMVSVSVMIHSFRQSVGDWIDRSIVADLFIAPASNLVVGLGAFTPPEAVAYLRESPGVEVVDTFREMKTTVRGESASLAVVEHSDRNNLRFVGGNDRARMERFQNDRGVVLVTESFAQRFRLANGDRVELDTPSGRRAFEIAGVYYDYTSDRGVILMARKTFEKSWDDPRVQSLAVYLAPGADPEAIERAFRERFSREGEFVIFRNASLRKKILDIFDQTFAVTYILRVIAIVVAVVGIFLSITTLVFERTREIGVLRSVGASRGQIRRLFLWEAGMLSLVASLLGLAAGVALSLVLTWVINKAFFGWTIALEIPWLLLAAAPMWIGFASLAAAWIPAVKASRIEIADAIRSE